jgi:hypothetical protein
MPFVVPTDKFVRSVHPPSASEGRTVGPQDCLGPGPVAAYHLKGAKTLVPDRPVPAAPAKHTRRAL